MNSFDSDTVNLKQETQNKIQDPNTPNATLDNPKFSTSASFSFNTDNSRSSDGNLSSDSDCEVIAPNLTEQLHLWSQKHNISHAAIIDLLHILKHSHSSLLLDSRTLLHTPRTVDVVSCDEGSFVYFGLERNLVKRASCGLTSSNYPLIEKNIGLINFSHNTFLSVSVNGDGLLIHTSSTKSFWPLLCVVDQAINKNPIVVALYYGNSKPANANNFLRPFVEECKNLETNGIMLNGVNYVFRVSCIIADSPTRSFIKCIVGHNSLHGCEKCTQDGIYLSKITWQYNKKTIVRTDALFKVLVCEYHQRTKSFLSELDVGLVTQVPLDYMHLVCLGVVKRLVRVWVKKGQKKCKLNVHCIENISFKLSVINQQHYPKEFSRRPRPIQMFKFWKDTAYRSFILYLGPVVMCNILPKELYTHFMLLHCAIYILASVFWKRKF
ncbi:hypothetical protein AVEN_105168-1 [Araneus ventricosus]|uniref:Uncharacterized protein n=2 Tax=Araneus ventricosus TaxID=182803 RepID=A0A4Y2VK45_ARAVE|nr:hypothetical protein AVEN_105168-1 [Araneus ventricosus]